MRQIVYGLLCLLGDPRFLTYDGTTGKWTLNEKALDDHFAKIRVAGATGIRLLPWEPWEAHPYGIKSQFQPYVVLGSKFDLAHFNTWYFPIARKAIEIAKKRGMTTWWCLGDNCQFSGGYAKWSPWVANIQGIGSFYEVKAFPLFKMWFEQCIRQFAGLDVRYPWFNEGNKPQAVALVKTAIFPVIKKYDLDPKKMTYGATMETVKYYPQPAGWVPTPEQPKWECYPGDAGMLDTLKKLVGDTFGDKYKFGIWKEVHGIGGKGYPKIPNRLHQALTWWARKANNGIRIWLSDDGVFDGDSLCDTEIYQGKLRRRPSATRWAEIAKVTKLYGNDFTIEVLPKTKDINCIVAKIKAISGA